MYERVPTAWMLTGTEGADAKRKLCSVRLLIAQRTGEVPLPGWDLSACPALVIPVAALGDVQNFMGSSPFMETDKMSGVALNKPSFLILQSLLLCFWTQCWVLQLVGRDCPACPVPLCYLLSRDLLSCCCSCPRRICPSGQCYGEIKHVISLF